jgi:amino acid transporter
MTANHDARHRFGTAPVFLTAISTILGAVMFLRFGYAVANVGFLGTVAIILLGHLVTIPTAMAIAEIATNQRVQGGGEYYIISRSFGTLIGASVGVALFLSQAISVAFYAIAFGEAFSPVFEFVQSRWNLNPPDKRVVTIPAVLLLAFLMLTKGANLGVKALYIVVAVLFVSLACFFLGRHAAWASGAGWLLATVRNPDEFFTVFAICFPAFTGVTAGVGLSGDLRDPRRSIPLGTLSAAAVGLVVYIAIAWKLAVSATPSELASDQLIMSQIALWGPIIPIGLACATISSALGSILVAPRTLQALAGDGVFPSDKANHWLAQGTADSNEPMHASLVTVLIALAFVVLGDVDFVAQIISMIFMVTYGSLCMISFLEHFAAGPSYRPVFRSRWYISLLGAIVCLWLMFSMSPVFAITSLVLLASVYAVIGYHHPDRKSLAILLAEAFFQMSRKLQIFLQQSARLKGPESWRPSVICISSATFERRDAFDLLRWISHRYGFGTYIHFVEGYLSRQMHAEARDTLVRLVHLADITEGNVYVDTLVSPSYTSAIAQLVQVPGIGGRENNMILFEFPKNNSDELAHIVENLPMIMATEFDVCILASSPRGFGYRREIHIWLLPGDFDYAGLMILLAYVILAHPEWDRGLIKVFAMLLENDTQDQQEELLSLIRAGRVPIPPQNVEFVAHTPDIDRKTIVNLKSAEADLTILGFTVPHLKRAGDKLLSGLDKLGNILFVTTSHEIELTDDSEALESESEESQDREQRPPESISVESAGAEDIAPV